MGRGAGGEGEEGGLSKILNVEKVGGGDAKDLEKLRYDEIIVMSGPSRRRAEQARGLV